MLHYIQRVNPKIRKPENPKTRKSENPKPKSTNKPIFVNHPQNNIPTPNPEPPRFFPLKPHS